MLNRRRFLGATAGAALTAQAQTTRPNVLLILADDLGYETLGCNGGTSYRTPHLDRMAAEGVRFTNAHAQPLCTPTRLQLMTGLYNNRNWTGFGVMNPKTTTFGHRMARAGYKTAIAGKWQFWSYNPPDYHPEDRAKGQLARDSGFDSYSVWHAGHTEDKGSRYGDPTYEENGKLYKDVKDQYGDDHWSQHLLSFFDSNKGKPVFGYFPMALTHGPFNPTPKSVGWTTQRLKNDKAYYKDMVEYMDDVIGRTLDGLDKQGVLDNTIVLFFGDNGTPQEITSRMGERVIQGGKGLPTDAGTHVPMLGYWRGTTPRGKVCDDLIDSTDFLPTMLDAAGLNPARALAPNETPLDGRSFLPQLKGQRGNPRDWIYCWHDPRPGWDKDKFKLEEWARNKRFKLYRDGRLYDVPADPLEQHPLPPNAGAEATAARRALQPVLDRMKRTGPGAA